MEENQLSTLPEEAERTPEPGEAPPPAAEESPAPQKEVDETPDPARLKSEIEELADKRRKAEEDAIYWRKQKAEARAEYFRGRGETDPHAAHKPSPAVSPEPKPSDFEDYDQFVVALTDHRVKAARAEWEQESVRRQQEQDQQQRMQGLHTKLQEGFTKYQDFGEVAFDHTATHITPMIVDILTDCDHPADVAYYLAKNRVEGVAISRMTPTQAARAIAKLEDKLATSAPQNTAPARKLTAAPPPINPVGGGTQINKDPNKMTQKEYESWRTSQGARRF